MKLITTIVAAFAVLLLAGCSKKDAPAAASVTYPTDPAALTSNTSFLVVYKSDRTGKTFYARRLSSEDASKLPEVSVIKKGTNAVLFVPLKDGKIVDVDASDRSEVEGKIPPGMLM